MPEKTLKELSRNRGNGIVKMGAKIANQVNTNQQSNMALSAYCVITQECSAVNLNFA